jgi:flagellar FliL protein
MKRNILTVLILALSIVNLVLMAIVIFTIVPSTNKTNNLITQVSQIIELELHSGSDDSSITANDISIYDLSAEQDLFVNLMSEAGKTQESYAKISKISLSLYKKTDDFSEVKQKIEESTTIITDKVRSVLSKYTKQEAKSNEAAIKQEIVKELNTYFDTSIVVDISFGTLVYE